MFCVQCCVCRKHLSSRRCRSELIDSAWVVFFPGQKCINKKHMVMIGVNQHIYHSWWPQLNHTHIPSSKWRKTTQHYPSLMRSFSRVTIINPIIMLVIKRSQDVGRCGSGWSIYYCQPYCKGCDR